MSPNVNGWTVLLRCATDELVVYQPPTWPPPPVLLLPVESPDLPPMHPELLARVKQDASVSFAGGFYEAMTGSELPKLPKRTMREISRMVAPVPYRRFVKGRDWGTKLVVWVEGVVHWVDPPPIPTIKY